MKECQTWEANMKVYLEIINDECGCTDKIVGCAYDKHLGENFCGIGSVDIDGNIKTECGC